MPETFGKRQRKDVKAKKAAAAEERRLARTQRRRDREAGLIEPGPPVATPEEIGADGDRPARLGLRLTPTAARDRGIGRRRRRFGGRHARDHRRRRHRAPTPHRSR